MPNGNDMQRPGPPMQQTNGPAAMDPNANNWGSMHGQRNNGMMYQSNSSQDHFGMQQNAGDDKRNVMPGNHHIGGDEWNHMLGANEGYMNPMSFSGYDQAHHDVKKDYESHESGANGYYMPSTSLGADAHGMSNIQ
jgi:hypothetical protein